MRNNITGEWNTESGWMTIAAPVEVSRAEDALLAARQPTRKLLRPYPTGRGRN